MQNFVFLVSEFLHEFSSEYDTLSRIWFNTFHWHRFQWGLTRCIHWCLHLKKIVSSNLERLETRNTRLTEMTVMNSLFGQSDKMEFLKYFFIKKMSLVILRRDGLVTIFGCSSNTISSRYQLQPTSYRLSLQVTPYSTQKTIFLNWTQCDAVWMESYLYKFINHLSYERFGQQ